MAQPALSPPPSDLDWIRLREEMNSGDPPPMFDRMIAKFKTQPLVPVGCLATTAALSYGLWSMRQGNALRSQYMMRTRVIAQGFTIAAAVIGTMTACNNRKKDEESE